MNHFHVFQTTRLAFAAALIAMYPGLAKAEFHGCTALKGTYAHTFNGTFPFPGPPAILAPFNGVGVTTFDGAGNVSITETAAFPGHVLTHVAAPGTYTLKPDCTGTLFAKDQNSGHTLQLAFVVADEGKTIYAIGTDKTAPAGSSLTFIYTRIAATDK